MPTSNFHVHVWRHSQNFSCCPFIIARSSLLFIYHLSYVFSTVIFHFTSNTLIRGGCLFRKAEPQPCATPRVPTPRSVTPVRSTPTPSSGYTKRARLRLIWSLTAWGPILWCCAAGFS
ncbi:hypothetical protein BCR34DRAFT_253775 [Clohesyomyces aquaticus]|uniref:Uncharacterized protein n=1 Tax=Clohesyomyces aquaticus TaxID=1231657 RepID=A0A1Y1Y3H6_9PLEO|nr:hypothetical protein BCR34DRAFT_253775 [Clohesyomyces aquaticus]